VFGLRARVAYRCAHHQERRLWCTCRADPLTKEIAVSLVNVLIIFFSRCDSLGAKPPTDHEDGSSLHSWDNMSDATLATI